MRGVHRGLRLAAALGAGALLLAVAPRFTGTTAAAFSGSTANAANAFGADTMAPPGTPVSVHKSVVGGMVQLTWTASTSSYVTGYTVQRAPAGSSSYTTIASIPLASTGFDEFSAGLTAAASPWDITTGPDGNLWFTENAANKIGRITPTGTITEYVIPTAASSPKGIAAGPDGSLWFTESAKDRIGRITTAGVISEYPVTAGSAPTSIVAGPDGNLWFSSAGSNKVGRLTTVGTLAEFPVGGAGNRQFGITVGPAGSLWVTETAVNKIAKVTTGGVVTEFAAAAGSLPKGITTGPSGNIRIAQSGTNQIGKVTPYAFALSVADTAAAGGPTEIAAGADGNVWFTESTGNKIASITPGDTITEYAIPTTASSPNGIASGPDGNIWFTETVGNKIGRYRLGLSTSFVDTTASYDAQYSYRVVATYKSWTATGGGNVTLSLNPSSGTDRTGAAPAPLAAADLASLAYPDKNLFATTAWAISSYSAAQIHGLQWGDATTAYAFGGSGAILKSTDGGVDWTAQNSAGAGNLEEGACLSASTCWAVGASGAIRYTSDGGANWVAQTAAPNANLTGVTAVDANHVWASGASGAIRFYNGTSWAVQTGAAGNLNDIYAFDATHAWAVGASGAIFAFNGTTWTAQTSPLANNLNSVDFISATTGWITGDKGTILLTTNGGQTWTAQTSPTGTGVHLRGLDALDATHAWASGDSGTILFYDGTSWVAQAADAAGNKIQAVAFYDANTGLMGSDVNNNPKLDLQLTQDGGTTWIALGDQNLEVAFSPTVAAGAALSSVTATALYTVGTSQVAPTSNWMLASYDGGTTWKYYPLPLAVKNVITVATVDLSALITTGARLQNLKLRFFVDQGAGATSHDVIQVQAH